jgi:hypothetical protein
MFLVSSRVASPMSMPILVVAVAVAVAACTGGPAVSSSSPTPTATILATTSPASASPAGSAEAPLIPDGTYAGPVQQVADLIAMINADTKLSQAQKTEVTNTFFELPGHTTFAVTLDLHAGSWTESQAVDGHSVVGSRANYAFPDDHTVVLQESCCGLTTFGVTRTQGGFSLKVLAPPAAEEDKVVSRVLFESGTFSRVP